MKKKTKVILVVCIALYVLLRWVPPMYIMAEDIVYLWTFLLFRCGSVARLVQYLYDLGTTDKNIKRIVSAVVGDPRVGTMRDQKLYDLRGSAYNTYKRCISLGIHQIGIGTVIQQQLYHFRAAGNSTMQRRIARIVINNGRRFPN